MIPTKKIQPLPLTPLTAITPLDGRYFEKTNPLSFYVSEFALIKTRIEIEAKFLVFLSQKKIIRKLSLAELKTLETLSEKIDVSAAQKVKQIENETRHDVKAVEKIFRSMVQKTTLEDITEYIHIGLTSEDINNLSFRLMLKRSMQEMVIPILDQLLSELISIVEQHKNTPMLARTHGQAAVPTTLGKEFLVFATRLSEQLTILKKRSLSGKLNGAVGNFNALRLTYPEVDWMSFSEEFVLSFGLKPNLITTQINTYEDIISYLQNLQRINNIILDFDQDMWRYISDNWFVQIAKKGEVGSSTMPQKVNPIDFENSEGNIQMANALIEGMVRKLPVSRLQRDLSDSTTIRNIGTILGFTIIAYQSTLTGLSRVSPNISLLNNTLNNDWTILSEGVQTILRKEGVKDPYTLLSGLTRGERLDEEKWAILIKKLPVSPKTKKILETLTPQNYIGFAKELCETSLRKMKR